MSKTGESATERLSRLLTMVPWLLGRRGIDLAEAAQGLGISEAQLEADLSLLFLCGYGQMPDELIDARWESGRVFVDNADAIARPLRLGVDEAVTLIVGLRALLDVPGLGSRDAIEGALAKLEAAAGDAGSVATRVRVRLGDGAPEGVLATARDALDRGRRLHLRYLVPGRDESTERDVDPLRVVHLDGRWYLEGWCHRAGDTRMFRLDRVEEITVLDVPGVPPRDARERDLSAGPFAPSPDDLVVTLDLDPDATWVADYYPVEERSSTPGGGTRIVLRTADTTWLVRLLLRLGGSARVVAPAALGDEVAQTARRALAAYA